MYIFIQFLINLCIVKYLLNATNKGSVSYRPSESDWINYRENGLDFS